MALDVPCQPELDPLRRQLQRLGPAIRLVPVKQLHLTLKFLGDVEPHQLADLQDGLPSVVATCPLPRLQLQGLGAFPRPDRPQVIWAGVSPTEELGRLASSIEKLCGPLGFPQDQYPYHPHVTLARVKFRPPSELGQLLSKNSTTRWGSWQPEGVTLFESILQPTGPEYHLLSHCPLLPVAEEGKSSPRSD